jgi:hypothetical protein
VVAAVSSWLTACIPPAAAYAIMTALAQRAIDETLASERHRQLAAVPQ